MNESKTNRTNKETLDRLAKQHGKAMEKNAEACAALDKEHGIKPPKYDSPARGRKSR